MISSGTKNPGSFLNSWDFGGGIAGLLCGLHCLVGPLSLAFLPGSSLISERCLHQTEPFIIGLAFFFGIIAVVSTFRFHAKLARFLILMGLLLLAAGLVLGRSDQESLAFVVHLSAAPILITGHLQNWKHCRHCAVNPS